MNRNEQQVTILYCNYRDVTELRHIVPKKIWFGATQWHPGEQWLLDAFDVDKQVERSFAMKDIRAWFTQSQV